MALAFSQIDDCVTTTLQKLIKKGSFVDMQTDLTDHVAVNQMWKKKTQQFSGGDPWEFQLQMDHNHSAHVTGLYGKDSSAIHDTMKMGSVSVRHVTANFTYDQMEAAFQKGGHAIVNLLETRKTAMMVSFYELLERLLWGKPEDSSDLLTPYGIAYWITKNATAGHNGGNPAGFTSGRANIDSDVYTRFKNYTDSYEAVTDEDLLDKMARAVRKSNFRSVVSHAQPNFGKMDNGIYVNESTVSLMERHLRKQNMNIGTDLASMYGKTLFKGNPITYVPTLDDDTSDPVYMIDWMWLTLGALAGWQENLSAPQLVPDMHTTRRVFLDASLNTLCTDPRRQAVIAKF